MLASLGECLLTRVLHFLTVPTSLECIGGFDYLGKAPSVSLKLATARRGREVQELISPAGGVVQYVSDGMVVMVAVFPRDVYAWMASTCRAIRVILDPSVAKLGPMQPAIPDYPHILIEFSPVGTVIRLYLRDFLIVTWRRLGSNFIFL